MPSACGPPPPYGGASSPAAIPAASGHANLGTEVVAGVRRVRRSWRWFVVLAGVAILVSLPAVIGAAPARARAVAPTDLAAAIAASTHPYSGYVQTIGTLPLPDVSAVDTTTSLLSGSSQLRVWWLDPRAWRVDLLSPTGESDTYGDATGTWTWDSEARRVRRTEGSPAVRTPRPEDFVPPVLAARLLAAARPDELQTAPSARVAGRSVPGVRIVPGAPATTIDHIDIWADADTGVALRVAVVAKGGSGSAFESQFGDVSLTPPSPSLVTFTRPAGVRQGRPAPDLVRQIASSSPVKLPAQLAGLDRGPDQTGAVATYGDGFAVVAVLGLPSFAVDQAVPDTIPLVDRPWGGQARVLSTSLVNTLAVSVNGTAYVLSGPVTLAELDRIAAVIVKANPG
jgi:hypothetical protein